MNELIFWKAIIEGCLMGGELEVSFFKEQLPTYLYKN
jgi:hypothetical protein